MWAGEVRSHAPKRMDASRSRGPERFSTNHSLAWSAIVARICALVGVIGSLQARHAAAVEIECLGEILLNHARCDLQAPRDLLVTELVTIAQDHSGRAIRWQFIQHYLQTVDAPCGVYRGIKSRYLAHSLGGIQGLDRQAADPTPVRRRRFLQ